MNGVIKSYQCSWSPLVCTPGTRTNNKGLPLGGHLMYLPVTRRVAGTFYLVHPHSQNVVVQGGGGCISH